MLSVREANDVNVLLDWLLGLRYSDVPTDDEAQRSAERLADSAYKRLSAGIQSEKLADQWAYRARR